MATKTFNKTNIPIDNIRNFSIIAHIDHGKSTIADCFIRECNALSSREMSSQVLDSMDLERERGITIKSQCVTLFYKAKNGQTYQLNLIDTPGHVDFSYEVSRSLAACEGALLVVDASQGVEAQTVANCYTAIEQGLEVLPILNKVDLQSANPEQVKSQIEDIIGLDASNAIQCSAKTGKGITDILELIVSDIPAPKTTDLLNQQNLQALIIDSWFDAYVGVVSLLRIFSGVLGKKQNVKIGSTAESCCAEQIGIFTPKKLEVAELKAGDVGYMIAGIKDIDQAKVGDTIIDIKGQQPMLAGFKPIQPRVFAGIFPISAEDFDELRDSLKKLKLNDSALFFEAETSTALGFGFRCGFLGMLHMEIIRERLEREFMLNLIVTAPTVNYEVLKKTGDKITISNPAKLPELVEVASIYEPIVLANIILPKEYLGNVISLCCEKRGVQKDIQYSNNQVSVNYELPLNELVMDFFSLLKSATSGYASMDYNLLRFQESDLVKLDILINGEKVDSLALLIHRTHAVSKGRLIIEKMKDLIPRQMFQIAIQAAIGSKIIARTNVSALRKNVTAKCYGGDITRKKKLLEKQKKGKKKMKSFGKITIPQEAFLAVLKLNIN